MSFCFIKWIIDRDTAAGSLVRLYRRLKVKNPTSAKIGQKWAPCQIQISSKSFNRLALGVRVTKVRCCLTKVTLIIFERHPYL